MKISCQACHSKYNVADDKVQGKIVKIRCRKCGATIVVNASSGAVNGSVPAPAPAANATGGSEARGGGSASADEWHVSVSDNDQRTMPLAELVNAYNANVIAQDTYVWTEGMQDWKPLGEVDAVVAALHTAAGQTAAAAVGAYGAGGAPAPVASSPAYDAPAPVYERPAAHAAIAAPAAPTPVQEPKRAAVGRREARARDLFATRTGEELQTGGLTGDDSRLTGQRNENSVLFSLEHLSKSADERPAQQPLGAAQNDDSGVIDLKALAAKAESMRPQKAPDLYAPAPPLGSAQPQFSAPIGGYGPLGSDAPRSRLPLLIGAGAGIAVLLVLGIVIGLKIGGSSAGPSAAAPAFQLSSSVPTATAEPVPTATASATAQASAASSAPVAVKPRAFGAGPAHPAGAGVGFKPPGGAGGAAAGGGAAGGTAGGGAAAGGGGGGGTPPAAAPAKKNDCGCNGDLMCMMKCSTH
jgi:predicted Zn finger-like uncharacterized protein